MSAEQKPPEEGNAAMKEIWAEVAKSFEAICGESLQNGMVKSFDDVQKKIEGVGVEAHHRIGEEQTDKWEKARRLGLQSLKLLKILVGAASQGTAFIPIPSSAANIASSALLFVFSIPEAIKGYNDAINEVFSEVSSALSQFQIYSSMDNVDARLIRQIHSVMVSFVKICAHVVKYRQGRKRDRLLAHIKSVFNDDSGLSDEMAVFKQALSQQRDVEGTITLAAVVETRQDISIILEKLVVFSQTTEEIQQAVQSTNKGVQGLREDADRTKTLVKIRDTLNIWGMVRLDSRTTQTCSKIHERCLEGTGLWIWEHPHYAAWTTSSAEKDQEKDINGFDNVLVITGPESSGKTSACALITKRLEEQKGRAYVAHYFFPANTKKTDDDSNPVRTALKYMAFQLARVDPAARTALNKACDAGAAAFRQVTSSDTLETLWEQMSIGASGAIYTLVFDGLDHLPRKQVDMLLKFVFASNLASKSAGRVRVLLSGAAELFDDYDDVRRIRMDENNGPDMCIVIGEALDKRGMLERPKPGSDQQMARDKILDKLPQKAAGSYSRLQFGINDVLRLLSTRTAIKELDRILDQSTSSHEAAIENLQRSLTADEIKELNELLKWTLFSSGSMTLDELESAMYLYSGTESLASLQYIIKNKYSDVLKVEDEYVIGQDGVKDYLQSNRNASARVSRSKDNTISMSITINNVDEELCAHFLWDLAHKAIREKFKFDFGAGGPGSALHSHSGQAIIAVDAFEAHHTILTRTFEYLSQEPQEQTSKIGWYLIYCMPHHLTMLRELEEDDCGELTPAEQAEIGQNLYALFSDDVQIKRHWQHFETAWWSSTALQEAQKWLMDSAVVRRVDKKWRDTVRLARSPTKGYLKELVKTVLQKFLRERSPMTVSPYNWIEEFMALDSKELDKKVNPEDSDEAPPSPWVYADVDWDRVSDWCQDFLGLPDSAVDSLWYERLAEASYLDSRRSIETVISLYKRAIEKENTSWRCYRELGKVYLDNDKPEEAIEQLEIALKEAQKDDATPKPEDGIINALHLLLGDSYVEAGNIEGAAANYLTVSKSADTEQAIEGRVAHLKAILSLSEPEATKQFLKDSLSDEAFMVTALRTIARDSGHDTLMVKLFASVKGDPELLTGIVGAMEKATSGPSLGSDETVEVDRFIEDEVRGVLSYDRGVAAYRYGISPEGTEPVQEALRLWGETRDLLLDVGGHNAFLARNDATTALAQHFFHSMVDGNHMDHVQALAHLAETDPNTDTSDSRNYLGTIQSLRQDKAVARTTLERRMKQALQILSDDIEENDWYGYSTIYKTLSPYRDFENVAIALSLVGQPDLVTRALFFKAEDIPETNRAEILEMVTKIAKETINITKTKVPDHVQQLQRIEAAKAHADSLVADTSETTDKPPDIDGEESSKSGVLSDGTENEMTETPATVAHRLVQSRLSKLQEIHSPDLNFMEFVFLWNCDGRLPNGKRCNKTHGFDTMFYHCTYCVNMDFCQDCFGRLRDPSVDTEFAVCSHRHEWIRIPPIGLDFYVGTNALRVRKPKVKPVEGDERVLEIIYNENDDAEGVTVEEWKEMLAKEWNIPLEELKTSDVNNDEEGTS